LLKFISADHRRLKGNLLRKSLGAVLVYVLIRA
jgi:hypothetical protein